jgi:hypothetical protein
MPLFNSFKTFLPAANYGRSGEIEGLQPRPPDGAARQEALASRSMNARFQIIYYAINDDPEKMLALVS